MKEDANIPQPRIRWKFRHLLLMLLPGFIFLISYPLIYIASDKYERANPPNQPVGSSMVIRPKINATAIAAALAGVALTVVVPAVLRKAAPGGKLKSAEVSLAGFILVVLNCILVFGGCSLGDGVLRHVHPKPASENSLTPAL